MRPNRSLRRTAGRGLLVLVAGATLVHAGPASARDGSTAALGGFSGTAQADGLHALYNPEGLLPTAPPIDAGAPDAYTTIATGPAAFARAAAADPGDLLANPDALLSQGAPGWKPGTVPAYPYRATASSATQPSDESSPGPGLDARASADSHGSSATATMPGSATPAIATFGSMTSNATTTSDSTTVTVHAHSEISNVNVLGVLTIGSVVTDITATSDGSTLTMSGGTVVSDAAFLGSPVVIDSSGVKEPSGTVNSVLANAGIHVTLAGPVQTGNDTAGRLSSDGLRIDFELSDRTFPALKTVLDSVPFIPNPVPGAPSIGDVIAVAEARHLVALELGRGSVALTARAARPVTTAGTSVAPKTSTATTPAAAPSARPVPSASHPAVGATPTLASAAPATRSVDEAGAAVPIGAGIGVLALLTLLVQPFLGDRIARGAAGVLGAEDAGSCPWEEL